MKEEVFYIWLYGTNEKFTGSLKTVESLDQLVTDGLAVKMKVWVTGLYPDEEQTGDFVELVGGVLLEEFNWRKIYLAKVFGFTFEIDETEWSMPVELAALRQLWQKKSKYLWVDGVGYPHPVSETFPLEARAVVGKFKTEDDADSGLKMCTIEMKAKYQTLI